MGTPEIVRVLDEDGRAVRALADAALPNTAASAGWEERGSSPEALYAAAVAFDTKRHRPTRENLLAIAALLEDAARTTPLVVTPAVKFVSAAPEPPPVPPLPIVRVKPKSYVCF